MEEVSQQWLCVSSRRRENERQGEKKGHGMEWESKEAENLCNNRETSDSPSRKKTGKGSKGRGAKSAGTPASNTMSYCRRLAWRRDDNRRKKCSDPPDWEYPSPSFSPLLAFFSLSILRSRS